MGMLPPVVATLLADTKEYQAKMDESIAKMDKLGAASKTTSEKMAAFGSKAATAVLGVGVAMGGYALDAAYKYQESLDKMANLTGMTKSQVDALGKSFLTTSNATSVSAANLATAYTTIYQSGMRGAQAQKALLDSSKLSVITNTDLATTTQALIAVENSHIAKGMSMNAITGKLVESQHHFAGSMSTMANLLSGRVGVALASAGVGLNNLLGIGDSLSSVLGSKGSRSMASFATGILKFYSPMYVLHVTTKKTYKALSNYALALKTVGLNQQKLASDMQSSGGIVTVLKYLNDVSQQTHESLRTLVSTAFGSGASPIVLQLLGSMGKVSGAQSAVSKAGGGTLATGWEAVQKQLGFRLHDLAVKLQNLAIVAGDKLLPAFTNLVGGATGLMSYLGKHPAVSGGLVDIGASLFGAAAATRLAGIGISIAEKFGAEVSTAWAPGIGAAIGLGILLTMANPQSKSDYQKAHNEWRKNKLGGAYDIAAITANTFIDWLPGHPGLPILGQANPGRYDSRHTKNADILPVNHPTHMPVKHKGETYGPTRPGGTATWHVKVHVTR